MTWLISKALYEKWHCSQEQAEEYLEDTCLDGKQFVQSSGNPTQLAYLSPDKMTKFSRLSRFGMTFKPLTESRGEDLLTWFREDFLAKTYPVQEEEQELKGIKAVCGIKWHESFAKYDQERSMWRIRQCSLFEDLETSLETWPRWGFMRDGECFHAEMSAVCMREQESGFTLPTVVVSDNKGTSKNRFIGSPHFRGAKMSEGLRTCAEDPIYLNPLFGEVVMAWPLGWTDLKPLGTDKFQSWQQQHLESYQESE